MSILKYLILSIILVVPATIPSTISYDPLWIIKFEKIYTKTETLMKGVASAIDYLDVSWLAMNIYHEARGEKTMHGKMAVAFTTLNRVYDKRWPNTIEGVVNQAWQFSWTMDQISDVPKDFAAWEECWMIAKMSIDLYKSMVNEGGTGDWLTKGANHYHSKNMRHYPRWASRMQKVATIGNHIFYKI